MKIKKILAAVAAGSMAASLLAGCGSAETTAENAEVNNTQAVSSATQATESETAEDEVAELVENTETVTVTEGTGEIVIASSVSVVQILDALGVPMAGVPTSSYELPESVADAARIGNPMSPDMEVITSLEPDVVVSVDSLSSELSEQFEHIGAESYFVNLSGYEGLKETVAALGERFHTQEKAAEIIEGFEAKETEIHEQIAGKESPRVLIIFGSGESFMVAAEESYVGDLVKQVGGENVITDAPSAFSPVDMEYLASQNPDYILFMTHANPEESLEAFKTEFETNAAWQNFDAVKNDKVVALDTNYFGMTANLYAADALENLVSILYGEN